MVSLRILVVALNFPPEVTGGAATTGGRVKYFASQGHRVDVVAGLPHYPLWRVFPGYRRLQIRERLNGADVRRRWHYVPSKQTAFGRSMLEATFSMTAVPTAIAMPRPDVVLSVMPAVSAGLAGAAAAKRFGVPHGVLVLDLTGRSAEQSGMSGGRLARRVAEPIEGWVMRQATRVGIITDGFREAVRGLGVADDRIDLIVDWKETVEPTLSRAAARQQAGLPPEAPILLHTGNIGYKQGLEHVVSAAVIAARELPALKFVFVGDGSQRALLEASTRACGLSNVIFLPLQAGELYPSLLGSADVLLLHQRATVVEMSLPSKLFDYFASGRPVIAAVNPLSEAAHEVTRSGAGKLVVPEDPRALVDGVRELLANPTLAADLGDKGQRYVRDRNSHAALAAAADRFIDRLVDASNQEHN